MAARCVPFTAARIKSEAKGREGKIEHKVSFFFCLVWGWGVIRMQWCVQVEALFNTLWLSPYSPDSRPICPLFSPSAFFFSSAFKMTVHPSVQLANWALTMTGPLVNSDHWNPYRRAAFQHLHFLYKNHRHLSGTDPLLPLRRLSEAGRGQETK